LGISLVH
jgi:hypothetical protein